VTGYRFIAVEGNIGAGKTTLATKLAAELDATLVLEHLNRYLAKFYRESSLHEFETDTSKYAFLVELSFLTDRFQQLFDLSLSQSAHRAVVSDYFIDKSLIFAKVTLSGDQLAVYSRLFDVLQASLPRPDLIVYLEASTHQLLENIGKRARLEVDEQGIPASYLEKLEAGYARHLAQMADIRIVTVKAEGLDFENNSDDYREVLSAIGLKRR
jgi:deoxyadenosine/deoxycytidine kinase